ncbi:unnamed protein product [Closterium sp. NIES-65]|nr:unnamed protein product [Closterium sp. NIES-65]
MSRHPTLTWRLRTEQRRGQQEGGRSELDRALIPCCGDRLRATCQGARGGGETEAETAGEENGRRGGEEREIGNGWKAGNESLERERVGIGRGDADLGDQESERSGRRGDQWERRWMRAHGEREEVASTSGAPVACGERGKGSWDGGTERVAGDAAQPGCTEDGMCACGHVRLLMFPGEGALPVGDWWRWYLAGRQLDAQHPGEQGVQQHRVGELGVEKHGMEQRGEEHHGVERECGERRRECGYENGCGKWGEECWEKEKERGKWGGECGEEEKGRGEWGGECGEGYAVTLVVIDGTWEHAKEMMKASGSFLRRHCAMVCLPFDHASPGPPPGHLGLVVRKEPHKGAVSTVEAVARALDALEKDVPEWDGDGERVERKSKDMIVHMEPSQPRSGQAPQKLTMTHCSLSPFALRALSVPSFVSPPSHLFVFPFCCPHASQTYINGRPVALVCSPTPPSPLFPQTQSLPNLPSSPKHLPRTFPSPSQNTSPPPHPFFLPRSAARNQISGSLYFWAAALAGPKHGPFAAWITCFFPHSSLLPPLPPGSPVLSTSSLASLAWITVSALPTFFPFPPLACLEHRDFPLSLSALHPLPPSAWITVSACSPLVPFIHSLLTPAACLDHREFPLPPPSLYLPGAHVLIPMPKCLAKCLPSRLYLYPLVSFPGLGWLEFFGISVGLGGVAFGGVQLLQYTIYAATGGANNGGYFLSSYECFGITAGVLIMGGLLTSLPIQVIGRINVFTAVWQMVSTLVITVLLPCVSIVLTLVIIVLLPCVSVTTQPASFVFTHYHVQLDQSHLPNAAYAFVVALQLPLYGQYSYDTVAHMAEETKHADRTIPLAMVSSLSCVCVLGWGLLVSLTFCIENNDRLLGTDNETRGEYPVVQIIWDVFFHRARERGRVLIWDVFLHRCGSGTGAVIILCCMPLSLHSPHDQSSISSPPHFPPAHLPLPATAAAPDYGSGTGAVIILCCMSLAFFLGVVGGLMGASRAAFSLSRDSGLPFASLWRRVNRDRTPIYAVWLCCGISILFALPLLDDSSTFHFITSLATVAWVGSYAVPIFFRLIQKDEDFEPGAFNLADYVGHTGRRLINLAALLFVIYTIATFLVPVDFPITPSNFNYACVGIICLVIFFCSWWLLDARHWFVGPYQKQQSSTQRMSKYTAGRLFM